MRGCGRILFNPPLFFLLFFDSLVNSANKYLTAEKFMNKVGAVSSTLDGPDARAANVKQAFFLAFLKDNQFPLPSHTNYSTIYTIHPPFAAPSALRVLALLRSRPPASLESNRSGSSSTKKAILAPSRSEATPGGTLLCTTKTTAESTAVARRYVFNDNTHDSSIHPSRHPLLPIRIVCSEGWCETNRRAEYTCSLSQRLQNC